MPWFRVDDGFSQHPKVLATSLAARGLWVTAGSWSSLNRTGGVVPRHVLLSLGGTPELASELVAAGLWKNIRQGWRFHDWQDRNPTKQEASKLHAVRAAAGRKGGLASANARSKTKQNASQANQPPNRKVREPKGSPNLTAPGAAGGAAAANGTRPAWCGRCDPRTRQTDSDPPGRCPTCHPLAAGLEAQAWRQTHPEEAT